MDRKLTAMKAQQQKVEDKLTVRISSKQKPTTYAQKYGIWLH